MKCPVCKTTSLHLLESEEQPHRLVCDECNGQWIRSFQYWKWLNAHGKNLPETPAENTEYLPTQDSTEAKLCPECGRPLSRRKVGHGLSFYIDRCPACGGFWFDKNEWEILKSRNLHDDVHFIFSAAWQHKIAQDEGREAYDNRVEAILGKEDCTKVRDFKQWATAHPKHNTIMAFLADLDM